MAGFPRINAALAERENTALCDDEQVPQLRNPRDQVVREGTPPGTAASPDTLVNGMIATDARRGVAAPSG
jgi:hypothetical protein